jgi:hypothetical protein
MEVQNLSIDGLYLSHEEEKNINKILESFYKSKEWEKIQQRTKMWNWAAKNSSI